MDLENYYIKDGYIPNPIADIIYGGNMKNKYWNKWRIAISKYDQFDVYKYAISVIRRYKLKSIMDVGCGIGRKLKYVHDNLSNVTIIGIDQKFAIDYNKKHFKFGKWYIDDIKNPKLDLKKMSCDLVISADVIEHLINPDNLLNYIRKGVKKNGLILISTPERDLVRGKDCLTCPNKSHIREWNSIELRKYLENRKFKIIRHKLLYPIKIRAIPTITYGIIFYREIFKHFVRRNPIKYNQMFLMKLL